MSHNFFAYMSRMKHIKRWSLMRNTWQEDIAQHSLQVAMIAHALALYKNARFGGGADPEHAACLALYHEASEVITGDMPTPIKYFSQDFRGAFGKIEQLATQRLLLTMPDDLRPGLAPLVDFSQDDPEWARVKAADTLSAYIKCIEEERAGNREFSKAARELQIKLKSYALPEVDAFLQDCLPSFSLTLDELD